MYTHTQKHKNVVYINLDSFLITSYKTILPKYCIIILQ